VSVRRTALALTLACALAVALAVAGCGSDGSDSGAPAAGATPKGPIVGINANTLGWGTQLGRAQSLISATGVGWLREELKWPTIEPRRGARHWGAYDRLLVGAAHRGLRVLVVINGIPSWARRPNGGLPTNRTAYGRLVRDVVARYGAGGTFWRAHSELRASLAPSTFELFNEPYFFPPQREELTATRYAKLAAAGIAAGRAADPAARFLIAADTSYLVPEEAERWLTWLDRAEPRLLGDADGFVVHPYAPRPATALRQLDAVTSALGRHGADQPLWVTEIGWSTCTVSGVGCVSEATQAANLSDFFRGAVARASTVAAVFAYSWHDLPGPISPSEEHFGVLRLDGSRKPAWRVLHAVATRR
jgi:hypothetical protein